MTSPAPLDPGLERQPGEPLGGYVARLEDTRDAYLRSAQQIAARLSLVEAACIADLPPAPLVLHPSPGAQAGQEGASGPVSAPEPAEEAEETVIGRLRHWVAEEMARDRGYLVSEISEATGITANTVQPYLRGMWHKRQIKRQEGRGGSYRYFHPTYTVRDLRAEVLAHFQGLPEEQQDNAAAVALALGGGLSADDVRPVLASLLTVGLIEEFRIEEDGETDLCYWRAGGG